MKSLNEYIIESKLEENILRRLFFHTCIEFKLNNNLYPYVVESLGKFDNAGKVVKHIIDTLKRNFESQTIDCTNDNVYFKYINITLNTDANGYGTYLKFKDDTVYLEIGAKSKDYFIENIDRYTKTIIHELLHGFEDYNRIKNTGQGIFAYLNDKYKNSFANLNSENDVKMWLSRCNYLLNDQERNAYLSQLETDIESLFKTTTSQLKILSIQNLKTNLKILRSGKNILSCLFLS